MLTPGVPLRYLDRLLSVLAPGWARTRQRARAARAQAAADQADPARVRQRDDGTWRLVEVPGVGGAPRGTMWHLDPATRWPR